MTPGQEIVRQRGTVENFHPRKGFGFIRGEDGTRVFVHWTDIRGKGRRELVRGETVEYTVRQTEHGTQAGDVVRLNPPPGEGKVGGAQDEASGGRRTW